MAPPTRRPVLLARRDRDGQPDDPTESGIRPKAPRPLDTLALDEDDGLGFDTPSEARRLFSRPPGPHDEERALMEGAFVAPTSLRPAPNQIPQRPILASECLKEHAAPTEPGKRLLRVAGAAMLAAAVLTLVSLPLTSLDLVRSALFAAAGAIALAPRIPYEKRTRALAAVAAVLTVAHVVMRVRDGRLADALLAVVVPVLAGSLFFRSYHRASRSARVGVGLGIGLGALWLGVSSEGVVITQDWSAVDHLSSARIGLDLTWIALLGCSLLAFMGPDTNAGGRAIGMLVVAWFVLESLASDWLASGLSLGVRGLVASAAASAFALIAALGFAQQSVCFSKKLGSLR